MILLFLIFGVVTVCYDMYTDVVVAADFIGKGDYYWGGCTLAVVFAPFLATLVDFIIWKMKYRYRKRFLPKEKRSWTEVAKAFPLLHIFK